MNANIRNMLSAISADEGLVHVGFVYTKPADVYAACPHDVEVRARIHGYIGDSYVKRRKGGDPKFELSPRVWGEKIAPCIIEHKGSEYLEVFDSERVSRPVYMVDGEPILKAEIKKYLKPKRSSESIVHTYRMDRISEIEIWSDE